MWGQFLGSFLVGWLGQALPNGLRATYTLQFQSSRGNSFLADFGQMAYLAQWVF